MRRCCWSRSIFFLKRFRRRIRRRHDCYIWGYELGGLVPKYCCPSLSGQFRSLARKLKNTYHCGRPHSYGRTSFWTKQSGNRYRCRVGSLSPGHIAYGSSSFHRTSKGKRGSGGTSGSLHYRRSAVLSYCKPGFFVSLTSPALRKCRRSSPRSVDYKKR